MNRDVVKLAVIDIESRFKEELTHDYFRNKLKRVVTAEEVKHTIVRCRPRTLLSKTEVEIEEADFVESTVDTGKGFFCCMPVMKRK